MGAAAFLWLGLGTALAETRPMGAALLRLPLAEAEIDSIYRPAGYRLLWSAAPDRAALRAALEGIEAHGLRRDGFEPALAALDRAETKLTPEDDLAISRGALRYARAMHGQLVSTESLEEDWDIRPAPFDAAGELGAAAARGALSAFLIGVQPSAFDYRALQAALARYRALAAAGGWPRVPALPPMLPDSPPPGVAAPPPNPNAGETTVASLSAFPPNAVQPDGTLVPAEAPRFPVLEPGADDPRVPPLRARLAADGEPQVAGAGTVYDPPLVAAMQRFQERHGLLVDGRIGERSFAALNVSAETRARQIALNLERLRWEPRTAPARWVRVNVPDAHLDLFENGTSVLRMRVVVGARKTSTPSLAGVIDRVTVWPRWTLPYSIASKEQLPKLKQNINHLAEQNIVVVGHEGDPHGRDIDWRLYREGNFPFRLRQLAGPDNALGRFRFNFNNRFAVYLHDTPTKKTFTRSVRAASHGCVRLEDARALALALLGPDRGWGEAEIDALLAETKTQDFNLKTKVPVRLVYFTVFVESDGRVNFRSDLYGRDATLARALERARI